MKLNEAPVVPTWVRMYDQINQDRNSDPILAIKKDNDANNKPRLEEPALVHPFNSSVIKIRNNGIIDLWTAADQGFRMDPAARTINIISDGLKEHLNYSRAWIVEDLKYWAKKGFLFEAETGDFVFKGINFNAQSTGNTDFTTKGNMAQRSVGTMDIKAQGSMEIDSRNNMTISCAGNLTIKASRVDFIQG